MEIEKKIHQYILENMLFSDDPSSLKRDMSLVEDGVIDSTGVLEIIEFIEESFSIKVDDEEMVPENFDSVEKITAFIQRKLA